MNEILQGDTLEVLKTLPNDHVDTIITSPPYWGLRDYGVEGQLGLEPTLDEFLSKMLKITKELQRVLKPTGVMFWNHGDCYLSGDRGYGGTDPKYPNANKPKIPPNRVGQTQKCLAMQNYRLILPMIDRQGWILRNTIIWHKPNAMPSSAKDRFSNSYEPVFMLTKRKRYWFDLDAVRKPHKCSKEKIEWHESYKRTQATKIGGHQEGRKRELESSDGVTIQYNPLGKNPGDLWKISTQPFPEAHFATFPEKLIEPMIKAACPEGGIVLDPFGGSGTVGVVAKRLKRNYILIELNPDYIELAEKRIDGRLKVKEGDLRDFA